MADRRRQGPFSPVPVAAVSDLGGGHIHASAKRGSMADFVLTERRDDVAIITLNRPKALNAWHRPMREMLMAALRAGETDPSVRALVLTGRGDAFSAGQDLQEAMAFDPDRAAEWIVEREELYDLIRSLSKPL